MGALLVTLIAAGTLAFGAVYPWGYVPLFSAAALIGVAGLWRGGVRPDMRPVAFGLLLLWVVVAAQLLPMPRSMLDALSPSTADVAGAYSLVLSGVPTERLPLSIDPGPTQIALLALGALSLYLLGLPALLNGATLRSLPRTLALFAVPLGMFAVYTREHNNNLIYWVWQPLDGNGSNQAGPFINRNHFGGWMLMSLCLMVGWLLGKIERVVPDGGTPRPRPFAWLTSDDAGGVSLMMTAAGVAAIALFWTISRSSITSFGVATCLFAYLVVRRRRLGSTRRTVILATLGALLLAGIAWRGLDVLILSFLDERSLLSRLEAWRDGWDVVRDFPLFGTGLNTYSTAMLFYQTRNPGWHLAQAHNDYLQLLVEGGLLVTIPAAIAAVLLARAIRRNLGATRGEARGYWIRVGAAVGLLGIAVQEIFEFSLQIPVNALLFCTLAAIALTPVNGTSRLAATSRDSMNAPKRASHVSLP